LPSTIEQVHREYGPRGLRVLAVNLGEERARVEAWVREKRTTFPVLLDPAGGVTGTYEVTATPTVLVVSRRGRIVGKAVGPKAWTSAPGRAVLEALLRP
jgi:cytochrome c biogenesis protein CcmG/thiol:disulfide interchange protein DsbE